MSSECETSNFCIDAHRRALRPKKHLLSFHLNTEHTSLFCVKTRAGIQKTCTDGASSLPPLPSRPFKKQHGAQAQRQLGFFLLPTRSRSFSPSSSSCLFLARQVPGDKLCSSSRELI